MARRLSKVSTEEPQNIQSPSYWDKVGQEVQSNQSKLSMILGALIILVVGILLFNFFNREKADLGPAQQTEVEVDVAPESLPGSYTVKTGDTLFAISEKYYGDGYKYAEVAKVNNLTNPDQIEKGQVLQIPKLEAQQVQVSPQPSLSLQPEETATGEGNTTIWGPKIEGNTYTVIEGDWLSKIAGRAYGDILAYPKISAANNITNPDLIYPGQVLTILR